MTDTRSQRIGVALGFFLSLALMAPLALPIASGRVFQRDDLGRFHLPVRAFFARCLAEGDSPLWHPGLYCGFYVHGEGQAGMDHPLHRLLYETMPLGAAFGLEMVFGYPLAFAGMALWLRRLGLRMESATFGAMVFTFSSFMLLRYVHMNAIEILAHLPWMLLAVEAMRDADDVESASARGKGTGSGSYSPGACPLSTGPLRQAPVSPAPLRPTKGTGTGRVRPGASPLCWASLRPWPAFGLAMLTASQGLLGYPQYLGLSLIVAGSYAIARLGRSPRRLLPFAVATGLGLLMAGAQIVPQIDALGASSRARPSIEFLGMNSLHPMNLLQILVPFAFRQGWYNPDGPPTWPHHESVAYLGAVVPASCAYIWSRRHHLGKWKPVATWAGWVGAIAIALSLGRYSPLFRLWAGLPIASLFRGPSRFMIVAQLAASVLAGIAFSDLAGREGRMPSRALLWPIAASLAAGIGLTMAVWVAPAGLRVEQVAGVRAMIGSTLWIASPCALIWLAARGNRVALLAMMVLAAVDSYTFAVGPILHHDRPVRVADDASPPSSVVVGRLVAPLNEGLRESARLVGGYVALTPRRRLDYDRPEALRVAGAGWRMGSSGRWEPLPDAPMPRARLVARSFASRDPAADLGRVNVETTAIVDQAIDLPDGPSGEATILVDRPGRMVVRAESIGRRLLVVSESHHAGWRAAIDGRPASVMRVNGDFLGCVVGPGRHDVALIFDPASARIGRGMSVTGLIACLAVLAASLVGSRRSVSPAPGCRPVRPG